jgi:CRISPR-associated protein Csm3
LGGGGSRGSGRVRFSACRLTWRGKGFYLGESGEVELLAGGDLGALQALVRGEGFAAALAE